MDNKKEQTELKATNIIKPFSHKIKKNKKKKKRRRDLGFKKKAGRHQNGAGRRVLQKRPRQNTDSVGLLLSPGNILFSIASRIAMQVTAIANQ